MRCQLCQFKFQKGSAIPLVLTMFVAFFALCLLVLTGIGVALLATMMPIALSTPILLGLIAVLLVLLLVLLVLLLLACFSRRSSALDLSSLLNLLPQLQEIKTALAATANSLALMAGAMRSASEPAQAAGDAVKLAGTKINVDVPIIGVKTENFANIGTVVVGLQTTHAYPLSEASDKLLEAGGKLSGTDSISEKLLTMATQCDAAADGIRRVRNLLPGA